MSVPLERFYDYIESLAQQIYGNPVLIYRFWPHGSKNLKNISALRNYGEDYDFLPDLYCHDQEPLCFDLYEQQLKELPLTKFEIARRSITGIYSKMHPNFRIGFNGGPNTNDLALLLHSEQRSKEVENYRNEDFVPVYYWSHAIIARDWFRYAQHKTFHKQIKQLFLIYNRAWSGTREYRLKFSDLLIEYGLQDHCRTLINAVEPDLQVHYSQYNFTNPDWKPKHCVENYFQSNHLHSCASADFTTEDYEQTQIEVVLETLFDDDRLHLTEKTLRPIACGQPFLLAGTAGSLDYLKSYGFKTFEEIWDESYDSIQDPKQRLETIVDIMASIAKWSPEHRKQKLEHAQTIADFNREYFFSIEFSTVIEQELKRNLQTAFKHFDQNNTHSRWHSRWTTLLKYPELCEFLENDTDSVTPKLDRIYKLLQKINS
jgi:hypothetical protein